MLRRREAKEGRSGGGWTASRATGELREYQARKRETAPNIKVGKDTDEEEETLVVITIYGIRYIH